MISLNANTALLLVGIALILINIVVGAVRVRANAPRAGIFSIVIALVACVLVTIALFSIAFTASTTSVTALGNNRVSSGANGSTLSTSNLSTPAGGSDVISQIDLLFTRYSPALAVAGGLGIVILSFILITFEREKPDFKPSDSYGFLNAGAGIYILVVALTIPTLPAQLTGTSANAQALPTRSGPVPTRADAETATATVTPTATRVFTEVPSLTPTVSETPVVLYTQVTYAVPTDVVGASNTGCTLTAQTTLNLRGDPSSQQTGIGRVFAGSFLNVTGRTADDKWWRVLNTVGPSTVEGWVSGTYVTLGSTCDDQKIPVVGPTPTASRTPRVTTSSAAKVATNGPSTATSTVSNTSTSAVNTEAAATNTPSNTPTSAPDTATYTQTSQPASATATDTALPCTIITDSIVTFHADPSTLHTPLGTLPGRTAINATGKTLSGRWLQVTYNGQMGWVDVRGVTMTASCNALTVLTVTPVP